MRSWVHRVLEDLGEKVTEAEWTLLWLAAETEDRARRHEPEATAREDGHEVADAPGQNRRRTQAWTRDAKTGQFIPVKEAKERPNTTVRERVPLPGKGRK